MKKIFIILCVSVFAVSCGSKDGNKVNSEITVSGSEGLDTGPMVNIVKFTGDFDILRKDTRDCSNTIRIISECRGLKITSNGFNADEEFCDINQGVIRTVRGDIEDRNPPLPDRSPPNPDNNGETKTVTLEGNVLKSELRISPRIAFTNTLTINDNGVLVKVSDLKRGPSRCVYQKRI